MAGPSGQPAPMRDPSDQCLKPTGPERRAIKGTWVFAVLCAALAVTMALACAALPGSPSGVQIAFTVTASVVYAVFAVLCATTAAKWRKRELTLLLVLLLNGVVWVPLLAAGVIFVGPRPAYVIGSTHLSAHDVELVMLAFAGVSGCVMAFLYTGARSARFDLGYLKPITFEALATLADVAVPEEERTVKPRQVARTVDLYISSLEAPERIGIPVALGLLWFAPLMFAKLPLPLIEPVELKKFLIKKFERKLGRARDVLRYPFRGALRISLQMVYIGYYNERSTYPEIGFRSFTERTETAVRGGPTRYEEGFAKALGNPPLRTLEPAAVHRERLDVDVAIVGSGAAGSTIAYELAKQGRDVLLLEGGKHVDPDDFTEDEAHQLTQLYRDGALQQSVNFTFSVLQGKCVGGSTVVNNAVCFDIPEQKLQRWNDVFRAGIDEEELRGASAAMRTFMNVQSPVSRWPEGGWSKFEDGVTSLGLRGKGFNFGAVNADIHDCPGCGYCNLGCRYGNKLSALAWTLPLAQQLPGDHVQIMPECLVKKIEYEGDRARELVADLAGRTVRIRAKTIVVCAGAIASPLLMMRSGIAKGKAGQRLGFNLASPVVAWFAGEKLNSFDGVQISHYLEAPEYRYVLETWFEPPVTMSVNMPGWFENHRRNMRRFGELTSAGVLVGTTTPNASLRRTPFPFPAIAYTPNGRDRHDPANVRDFNRVLEGLKQLGRIFLAGGATEVMFATFNYLSIQEPGELDKLDSHARDGSDLLVGTGHPQCGCAMSEDETIGVVGPDFRVHGFRNLFVCDASVFPCAITVNPQLTVMALAKMAAQRVLALA